ncbi:MAG: FkbM family methyltransferase [Actinomycetota bacterium]
MGIVDPSEMQPSIEVEVVAIDDYVRDNDVPRVRFIKLDVQGAELQALVGARLLLERDAPVILCELVDIYWGSKQETTIAELEAFLTDAGYRAWTIPRRAKTVGQPSPMNVLFAKRDPWT